jgi:hypothetical protein
MLAAWEIGRYRFCARRTPLRAPQPLGWAFFCDGEVMTDELSFKVVRSNGTDEVLARAVNMLIARGAYRSAARMYPEDLIELRQGAHVIEKSK